MRLGWKQGQKNQAYSENSQITAVKSFTTLGTGPGKTIFLNKGQSFDEQKFTKYLKINLRLKLL